MINRNSPPGFQRGDTINVRAGSAIWGSTLTLTKGVKLLGPGRANLTITPTADIMIAVLPDSTTIANEETIQVDGFTFDASDASLFMIWVRGASEGAFKAFNNLIITHNSFKNAGGNTIYVDGQVRGVIAANQFDRVAIVLQSLGNNSLTEWENGNWPFTFGSGDNLFFEDNTYVCSSNYMDSNTGHITSGQSGRIVIRYNKWDFNNCANQPEIWDAHGFQNFTGPPSYPGGGQTGTMVGEVYGNTVTNNSGFRVHNHRGSWGLYHNNIITGNPTPVLNASQYDRGCNSFVSGTWPLPNGQINNTYTFNITYNGNPLNMTVQPSSGTPGVDDAINNICPPVEDTDFWNLDTTNCTSSACASGIGRGTTAPAGTCSIGTGYWVASDPIATVDPNIIQNAIFYKCTATDTWSAYYTPYHYPHPLRM